MGGGRPGSPRGLTISRTLSALGLLASVFGPQANIGQKEDFEEARKKALKLGAKKVGCERWDTGWRSGCGKRGTRAPVPCISSRKAGSDVLLSDGEVPPDIYLSACPSIYLPTKLPTHLPSL